MSSRHLIVVVEQRVVGDFIGFVAQLVMGVIIVGSDAAKPVLSRLCISSCVSKPPLWSLFLLVVSHGRIPIQAWLAILTACTFPAPFCSKVCWRGVRGTIPQSQGTVVLMDHTSSTLESLKSKFVAPAFCNRRWLRPYDLSIDPGLAHACMHRTPAPSGLETFPLVRVRDRIQKHYLFRLSGR